MLNKLEAIKARFDQVGIALTNPEIINNQKEFGIYSKEYRSLEKIIQPFEAYIRVLADHKFAKDGLNSPDEDMRELAKMELPELEIQKEALEKELTKLLIPKDPQDDKNAILEIRAGTGGDEASLFAGDLLGMYLKYCSKKGWKTAIVSESEGTVGGYKEVIVEVTGEDVYGTLKFESGVHRVQRVPNTETQGRVHTSAATVAVLPEAQEVDVHIDLNDVTIDVYRSSGPGGQSVNTTDSAVRLTHKPTGLVVTCQDQKSQIKNREQAFKVLRSRLLAFEQEKAAAELGEARLSQVGSGGRGEKIRTYNYKDNRITDHRIGFTAHNLDRALEGDLDAVIEALRAAERTQQLSESV